MTDKNYKFDVAFSFLNEDEELAYALFNLLSDRLKCFIYSEEQKRLAGKDGEKEFGKVFSIESRIVVILHRKGWGSTNWTRIEETAIRNRGYEYGYDFALLIPLDDFEKPEWLPKNKIWIGLKRWGIESAASVIEARAQESGSKITQLTLADQISEFEHSSNKKENIRNFLKTHEGRQLAYKEFGLLILKFKDYIDEIKSKTTNWNLNTRDNQQNGIDILSYGYQISIHYYFPNTSDPYLYIAFFKGCFFENGQVDPFNQPELIIYTRYYFSINEFNQNGWSEVEDYESFITTRKLSEHWMTELFQQVKEEREENQQ